MNNELAYARVAQYPIESLYPSIGDKILNLFWKAELIGVVLVESAEGVLEHTDAQRYKLLTLIGAQVYNL